MKKSSRKFFAVLAVSTCSLGLVTSCGGTSDDVDVALVTDVGRIDDHSFNQSSWEGVVEFCDAKGLNKQYYQPSEDTNEAREVMIKKAVKDGADVVVLPGFLFEETLSKVQTEYPEVKFIILDGDLSALEGGIKSNTSCVKFKEEQAGFFAGYASVMEGYDFIGFLGGMAIPAVNKFGHGYVYGANLAAQKLHETNPDYTLKINYGYTGGFVPNDTIKSNAQAWVDSGIDSIFVSGGKIYQSVLPALTSNKEATMVGVDTDQSYESEQIVTSAMKNLKGTVVDSLTALYESNEDHDLAAAEWPEEIGGKLRTLGIESDAVALATGSSWRFKNYTEKEYNELYAQVKAGDIKIEVKDQEGQLPAVESYVTVDTKAYK